MIVLWCSTAYLVFSSRSAHLESARINNENLTDALSAYSELAFSTIASRLKDTAKIFPADAVFSPLDPEITNQLGSLAQETKGITSLNIFSSDGTLIQSGIVGKNGTILAPENLFNFKERPYFRHFADNWDRSRQHEFFIGNPVKSKVTGKWTVPLVYPRASKSENFPGLVVTALQIQNFMDFFSTSELDEDKTVAIAHMNGVMILRLPRYENVIGKSFSQGVLYTKHLPHSPRGSYEAKVLTEGTVRLVSYRKIDNFPLVVVVSKAKTNVLAAWRNQAIAISAFSVLISILLGYFLAVVRRQANALEEQEVNLRSLVDSRTQKLTEKTELLEQAEKIAKIGYWLFNIKSANITWSEEVYRIHGIPIGTPITLDEAINYYHPEDREFVLEFVNKAIEGKKPYSFEHRIIRPNGEIRHVQAMGKNIVDSDGEISDVFGVFADITDRKNLEEERQIDQERLKQAQLISSIGYYERTVEGETLYWSDEMYKIFGLEESRPAPKELRIRELVHPDDLEKIDVLIQQTVEGQDTQKAEFRILRPDGTVRFVSTVRKMIPDSGGLPTRILGTILDITNERQRDQQLLHAQKMEAVGQLSSGIAHDFNNLLMATLGNVEFLHDGVSDPDLIKHATIAKNSILRGAELTKRLLAFSSRQQLDPELSNVEKLVNSLREMFRGTLSENIEIEWNIPSDLWPVLIDQSQLESSLLNLVLNSRDAMLAGGTLTVMCRNVHISAIEQINKPDLKAGSYVTITVRDTGMGIQKSHLDKIIDPFFSTKGVGKGSGLGLSMVYGFILQSGGHVEIDSEVGVGTDVTLYLPRAETDIGDFEAKSQDQTEIPLGNGEKILIIEDEPDVRAITIQQLKNLGYEVIDGGDGNNLKEICDKADCSFDLVLSDVVLPNALTGPKLIEQIRECNPSFKALLMTGYAERDVLTANSGQLVHKVLSKPFTKNDLAKQIAATLKDKSN